MYAWGLTLVKFEPIMANFKGCLGAMLRPASSKVFELQIWYIVTFFVMLFFNFLRADAISDWVELLVAGGLTSSTLLHDNDNLLQTCQQLATSDANTSSRQAVIFLYDKLLTSRMICVQNIYFNFSRFLTQLTCAIQR